MFKQLLSAAARVLLVFGILLSLIFLAELARMFLLLQRISPVLGWLFVAVLAGGVIALLGHYLLSLRRNPRAVTPPPLPEDLAQATFPELRRYTKYLARYLRRLAENPTLDGESRRRAHATSAEIEEVLRHHPLLDDLRRSIARTEADVVTPLLAALGEKASKEVRQCVRDVMLGVTLSPYASIDLLFVLYRNGSMVLRIARIYRTRPAIREQLLILHDVFAVCATVSFLNIGRKLIENLFSQVPIVGRFIDDIGQGMGAGLMTSVAGHAAMDRCAAFRAWSKEEEAKSLSHHMGRFLTDVRDLFTRDLLPEVKVRILSGLPREQAQQAEVSSQIAAGISSAVDATVRSLDMGMVSTAVAGGPMDTSDLAQWEDESPIHHGRRRRNHHHRSPFSGAGRVLQTFGQRVKYTFRSRKPKP